MANKPHISNTEWGLVISALAVIDVVGFLLNFLAIGLVVNPFLDMGVGMAFPFYLHMRGQSMSNNKRLAGVVITFITDLISDGVLNFWFVDGIYNMYLAKAEEKLEELEQKASATAMIASQRNRIAASRTVTPINKNQPVPLPSRDYKNISNKKTA